MSLILVMEASRVMAEAAQAALIEAGYEVALSLTVADGLSACQERKPDLVLTEWYLQEGSGLDFLEKLATQEIKPPVILVTGCGQEETAARSLSLGAWQYLIKTESYLEELPGLARGWLEKLAGQRLAAEKERLKRRLEAQSELAEWLAHNFKNILAASIGYLNLIDLNNQNQDRVRQQEFLKESRQSQETAVDLLEQLIRLTAAEAGEAERTLLSEVVETARDAARAKVLSNIEAQYPEQLESARAKLGQVAFLNSCRRVEPLNLVRADWLSILEALLQNAYEAVLAAEDPRILVTGEKTGSRLEISVKDNGRGMSAKVLQHAREPFFSTKGEVGVGLGLSLASSLVLRQGGNLNLQSTPGEGTRVKLDVPL
ncbi:MAG: hybrid sensor histidine kinase/response regulator [Candidatus Adiutrix sp.]|nr:hybrid sensor histidine kinase/response regulator [Candidatus Adiutrix sp.]